METINGAGSAVVSFDNTQVETSVITCYMSDSTAGPWLVIATDVGSSISCASQNSGTSLRVALIKGVPGWWFLATVATV